MASSKKRPTTRRGSAATLARPAPRRLGPIGLRPTLHKVLTRFLERHDTLHFVQVGGFDGVSFDPLRPFVAGGRLTGLIVEPLPQPFAKLQALYGGSTAIALAACAVADREGEQALWRFKSDAIEQGLLDPQFAGTSSFRMEALLADEGSLGSRFATQERARLRSLGGRVGITCRTWRPLLDEHAITQVDLLQIDVQGYDLVVLETFDFARFRPAVVHYKHVHLSPAERRDAERLLAGFGYGCTPQGDDTLAILAEPERPARRGGSVNVDGAALDGLRGNVVFCAWTGANPLTPHRAEALLSIYREICCPVLFLTPHNIHEWELPHSPFHPAYPHLSETHRADYLRVYLMHHFGGGYTDLKRTSRSWMPLFERLRANPEAVGLGYREIGPHGVAPCGEPLESELRRNYGQLIGNCAYIFRRRSALTTLWMEQTHRVLDAALDALATHPARHPMDQNGIVLPDGSTSHYPLRWTEMLGEIFHPLVYAFKDQIIQADIAPSFQDYR